MGLYPVKTQTIQFGSLKNSWMPSSLVASGIYSSELKRKKRRMKGATLFLIAHLMQVNCGMISHILLGPVQTLESNLTRPSTSGIPVPKVGESMVPTLAANTCSLMIQLAIWPVSICFTTTIWILRPLMSKGSDTLVDFGPPHSKSVFSWPNSPVKRFHVSPTITEHSVWDSVTSAQC